MAELQALLDTKQMLDAEIAIYRTMLEGEESRYEKERRGRKKMIHSLQSWTSSDGRTSRKDSFSSTARGY